MLNPQWGDGTSLVWLVTIMSNNWPLWYLALIFLNNVSFARGVSSIVHFAFYRDRYWHWWINFEPYDRNETLMSAMFCHSHLTFHDPFCSFYCHSFSIKQMSLRHSRNRTATPTHIPIHVHTHKPTHYHTLTLTHVRGRTQTNSITIKSLIFYLQSPTWDLL